MDNSVKVVFSILLEVSFSYQPGFILCNSSIRVLFGSKYPFAANSRVNGGGVQVPKCHYVSRH